MPCERCRSYAINPGQNGRGDDDLHLCDVCYWRARAESFYQENQSSLEWEQNGMLGVLAKLSEQEGAVTFQRLTGQCTGFKALPSNRKRWKKGEKPVDCEIRYIGHYDDALQLCQGNKSKDIAFIVWVPRKEFLEILKAKKVGGI